MPFVPMPFVPMPGSTSEKCQYSCLIIYTVSPNLMDSKQMNTFLNMLN